MPALHCGYTFIIIILLFLFSQLHSRLQRAQAPVVAAPLMSPFHSLKEEGSYHRCHLSSSHLTSADLVSSEPSVLRTTAVTANWVVRCEATRFAAAATIHSNALTSDEMRSVEVR